MLSLHSYKDHHAAKREQQHPQVLIVTQTMPIHAHRYASFSRCSPAPTLTPICLSRSLSPPLSLSLCLALPMIYVHR